MYYDYASAQERSLAFAEAWRGSEPTEQAQRPCALRFDINCEDCIICSGIPEGECDRYEPD